MGLLVDWQIEYLCNDRGNAEKYVELSPIDPNFPMLEPYSKAVSGQGKISYGVTHAGYDLRLGEEFVAFEKYQFCSYWETPVIDPKRFNDPEYRKRVLREFRQNTPVVIPPNSYILGRSLEYIRMPRHLKGRLVGKSTMARSAILINTTPIEPGWHGILCIEIGNCTNMPAVVYPGEGIAQLEIERLDDVPEVDYEKKGGKYQGQTGVTLAIVK